MVKHDNFIDMQKMCTIHHYTDEAGYKTGYYGSVLIFFLIERNKEWDLREWR